MNTSFAENLNFLCGFFPSIAEVCRQMDINRQQFNKYLSGHTRPSRANMRRICNLFGVSEAELLLDPDDLQKIFEVRKRPVTKAALDGPLHHLDTIFRSSLNLERYVGYYYRYFYAFGFPGMIVKSLLRITSEDQRYYTKNIEILREPGNQRSFTINKYLGVAFYLGDRIQLIEYEALQSNSISQSIYYPTYHSRVDKLVGIQTGAPLRKGRRPGASKVLLEYLGKEIDTRKALRRIGLFEPEEPEVPTGVVELIQNRIEPGHFVLDVEEL
ncbi:MAG: helix-turn-helix transcriptional regulator [Paracoccaceae bacterium]|nr:helix-turn-helix transcriptional regulator [Paracoccaceae bacterium]